MSRQRWLTNPAPKATVAQTPGLNHGAAAASQAEIAFAICPQGGSPGTVRITGEVIHLRGSEVAVTLLGDLEGAGFGRFDSDLLLDDFSGPARGDFRYEVTQLLGEEVSEGGFAGRHHGQRGPGFSGRAMGHGFGDLEGLKIRYTFAGRGPGKGFEVFAVITDPSGSISNPAQPRVAPPC